MLSKRYSLFEFEDLSWCPNLFRNYMTDVIGYQIKYDVYEAITVKIANILIKLKCNSIVDLCSGSGDPALLLQKNIQHAYHFTPKLTLTDKYPNIEKFSQLKSKTIDYCADSVDANNIPKSLQGFRSMFAAFHHFKPPKAQEILQNAIDNKAPIGIFEFTERTWKRVFFMLLGTLHVFFITPFIKPFKLGRLFFTYLLPVIPTNYFWDGLISNLRTYNKNELIKMINNLNHHDSYIWEIDTIPTKIPLINITYLIGYPNPNLHPEDN